MMRCPGIYCGRYLMSDGNFSDCGACPRGMRVDDLSICTKCTKPLNVYNWCYLIFMVSFALTHICRVTDFELKGIWSPYRNVLCSIILEVSLAALLTILFVEPFGSFQVYSCGSYNMMDWYSYFFNPTPNYGDPLYCTQEAVYPLYTMVFIFYALSALFAFLIRPMFISRFKAIENCYYQLYQLMYSTLLHYPICALLHGIWGGVLYVTYPYLTIFKAVVCDTRHNAMDQKTLIRDSLSGSLSPTRKYLITCFNWISIAFGVISWSELEDPYVYVPLILLFPTPTIFYKLTEKLTDPRFILRNYTI